MLLPLLVAAMSIGLLATEWISGSRPVRIVIAVLATAGMLFFQPSPYIAAREAISLDSSQRVVRWTDGRQMSDYESGVVSTQRMVEDNARLHRPTRAVLFVTIVWLALSPAVRSRRLAVSGKTDETIARPAR